MALITDLTKVWQLRRQAYPKVQPGSGAHKLVDAAKQAGAWVCDSADHNNPRGCSNPACFKYRRLNTPYPNEGTLWTFSRRPPANGTLYALDELQRIVGGSIQIVILQPTSGFGNRALVVNEDGRGLGLPLNVAASVIWGDTVVGDALVCGTGQVD